MAAVAIAPPENLPKKGNLSDNWRQWKQNFEIYLGAAGIDPSGPQACPLFLHNIGQYGRDIFNELQVSEPHKLEEFFEKFDEHCNPKKNITFDRYTFFNTKQDKNQTFDKFYALLKQRSQRCEFGDLTSSLIGTQIIIGVNDAAVRKLLLTMPDITVNDMVEQCKSAETARLQAQRIEAATSATKKKPNKAPTPTVDPNSAQKLVQKLDINPQPAEEKKGKPAVITNCKFCSNTHAYGKCPSLPSNTVLIQVCKQCGKQHKSKENCPAQGTTCHKCKKPNHFVKMCKA